MRVKWICLLPALLLSCSKPDNALRTPIGATGPSEAMSNPTSQKEAGMAPSSVDAAQQSVKAANACLVQDGKFLALKPRRAIGTEPFWSVQINGCCVRYSHMEDQKGTQVWTRYSQNPTGELWSGSLDGNLFELKLRNEPGCSDGMSDKRYPSAVELKIGTETRKGCAEPN